MTTQDRIELLERTVLYAISEVMTAATPDAGARIVRPTKYWSLVNAVRERLQDASTCPLSIAELCVELGVSRRTAQYAFQDTLNLNPIAYLRAVRLNHVRRELRLGDSVTTAATVGLLAPEQFCAGLSRDVRRTAVGHREDAQAL